MKQIDQLVGNSIGNLQAPAPAVTAARGRDHIDTINQVFAELELAYHNQFHKAFAQADSLSLAKKYWSAALADFPPEVLRRAVRHVVQSQQFLPSLATMIAACEDAHALFGLPTAEVAYREACLAPEPKADYRWSHAAVYHAGRETGWFALANESQSAVLPLFAHNYDELCKRVMHGESLAVPVVKALPASVAAPLDPASARAKLQALRTRFDL